MRLNRYLLFSFAVLALPAHAATVNINSGCLNFRARSSGRGTVLRCLPKGAEVTVLGRAGNGYSRVKVGDQVGYISRQYLASDSEARPKPPTRMTAAANSGAMSMRNGGRAGRVTDYYTMVNSSIRRSDCSGEGNQIVNNRLIGSDCRPTKNCKYGIGVRGQCLIPCVHAAGGGAHRFGDIVTLPTPRRCEWGPFKGQMIKKVVIADVGGAVNGTHVDVFQGLCVRTLWGVCQEFVSQAPPGRDPAQDRDPAISVYAARLGLTRTNSAAATVYGQPTYDYESTAAR